jgi:hypothetical protein
MELEHAKGPTGLSRSYESMVGKPSEGECAYEGIEIPPKSTLPEQ